MARKSAPMDIGGATEAAEPSAEVDTTGVRDDADRDGHAAEARSARRPAAKSRRGRVLTEDDPLFALVGIGDSGIPGGISSKKHEALGRLRHT